MTPYQGAIFDLDGTLLNTIEDIADAMNAVLAGHHYPTHSIEAYCHMVGLGLEQLVYEAVPEFAREVESLSRLTEETSRMYAGRWKNKTRPYPGISEMLGQMKEKKVRLAVLSNKPHTFTLMSVRDLLPDKTFDLVVGAQDGLAKKPDPQGALKIAAYLGLRPEDILYAGDSGTDMKTAKAAGMFAVGVRWGFRSERELLEHGADKIVQVPKELLAFF